MKALIHHHLKTQIYTFPCDMNKYISIFLFFIYVCEALPAHLHVHQMHVVPDLCSSARTDSVHSC